MNASKKEQVFPDAVENDKKLDMQQANHEVSLDALAPSPSSANSNGSAILQDSWDIEASSDLPSVPKPHQREAQRGNSDTLATYNEEPEESEQPNNSTKKKGKLSLFGRRRASRRKSDGDFGLDVSSHSQRSTSSEYQGPQPVGSDGLPLKGCLSSHGRRPSLGLDDESAHSENPTTSKSVRLERRVSFSKIDVREYERTVGDHPCVETGPPLSLGWKYAEYRDNCIEQFEKEKLTKTREISVAPSPEIREKLLREVVSDDEIQKALADVEQTRRNRNETRASDDLQKLEEIAEAAKRKFKRFVKGKSKGEEERELWEAAHKTALEKATKEIKHENAPPPAMVKMSAPTEVQQNS